jgi:adenosylhomocysteine nucleosidase
MATADILFIASDPREFAGAMRFWSEVEPLTLPVHWSRVATWKKRRIVAIANGAGAQRASRAADTIPYKTLCNIGFCGALDPKLRIGDIVVADWWLQPRTEQRFVSGKIASLDHVAQTAEEKRRLRGAGYTAVEMEMAGLENRPCYCIKSVSDLADESFSNDFNAAMQPDGRMDIRKLLVAACARPFTRIPELKRFGDRAKIASKSLGDFLETCEF